MSSNEIIMLIVILAIDTVSICLSIFAIRCAKSLNRRFGKMVICHEAVVRTQDERATNQRIYNGNLDRRLTRLEKARERKRN